MSEKLSHPNSETSMVGMVVEIIVGATGFQKAILLIIHLYYNGNSPATSADRGISISAIWRRLQRVRQQGLVLQSYVEIDPANALIPGMVAPQASNRKGWRPGAPPTRPVTTVPT